MEFTREMLKDQLHLLKSFLQRTFQVDDMFKNIFKNL
jgi:hypothetical protein